MVPGVDSVPNLIEVSADLVLRFGQRWRMAASRDERPVHPMEKCVLRLI